MKQAETKTEPPSCLRPPVFMIGQNTRRNWVAQDQSGMRGGLFVNRAEALKFARRENGYRPHAVVMVSGVLELDMAKGRTAASPDSFANDTHRSQRVA